MKQKKYFFKAISIILIAKLAHCTRIVKINSQQHQFQPRTNSSQLEDIEKIFNNYWQDYLESIKDQSVETILESVVNYFDQKHANLCLELEGGNYAIGITNCLKRMRLNNPENCPQKLISSLKQCKVRITRK